VFSTLITMTRRNFFISLAGLFGIKPKSVNPFINLSYKKGLLNKLQAKFVCDKFLAPPIPPLPKPSGKTIFFNPRVHQYGKSIKVNRVNPTL